MARNWTDAQQKAIDSKARRLLVCAAAGSGKTAVLTERIIRYVTDKENPGSVSRLLVVTFTRAAAAELRGRIREQLEEKLAEEPTEHLAREVLAVSGARISTIHSFCYDLLRAEGAAVGVSGNVRLIDEHEDGQIMQKAMDEMIRERCLKSQTFQKLVESLVGYRNDANLGGFLIDLYTKISNLPNGTEFLRDCAEKELIASEGDFFQSRSGAAVAKEIAANVKTFKARYEKTLDILPPEHHYYPTVLADLDSINAFSEALASSYTESRLAFIESKNFTTLKARGMKGYDAEKLAFKALRQGLKDYLKTLEALFAQTTEETAESLKKHSDMLFELYETIKAFEEKITAAKRKADVCSFADLERLTVKLLYNEDGTYSHIARSVSECFDRIYIDEYQDVNETQRMIFDAVACNTRCFRVGDIKQNIYAFRGSDPSIIDKLREKYDEDGDEETENVFMSKNFRSSKTVLDYINEVFEPVFRGGRFRYDDSDMLDCGREKDVSKEAPVTLIMCQSGNKNEGTVAVREEVAVADEIERLVREERLENGEKIKYGDIALLFRSYSTHSADFIKELERRGIPVSPSGKRSLFAEPHVALVLSILQTADNPLKDVPLCSVLFSTVFKMSCDELTLARRESGGSLWQALKAAAEQHGGNYAAAYAKISEWRELARSESCDAFVRRLYNGDGIKALLIAEASGEAERRNVNDDLNYVYDMARSFSSSGNRDLASFVVMLEDAAKENVSVNSASAGDGNSVTVMTAHGSKGLEFPVCFVCKANAVKSNRDSGNRLQFSSDGGVGMFLTDPRGFVLVNTPTREALRLITTYASSGEEERILYVALTRARERLYVTAGNVKPDAEYEAECDLIYGNLRLPCGTSKILDSTLRAAKSKPKLAKCITVMPIYEGEDEKAVEKTEADEVLLDEERIATLQEELQNRLNFTYPKAYLSRIPAKISVSDLSPSVLDEAMPAQNEGDSELSALGKQTTTDFADAPRFISAKTAPTAAEAGTATHQFLQFCDISNAKLCGVRQEAERLFERGFITERQKSCLRFEELEAFVNGEFAERLENADAIRREFRFNCFMPAHKLTENEELSRELVGRELAVQGVIDGFFLEGEDIWLFDYKTDRIPKGKSAEEAKELLCERYRWQLSCYAEALKRIFSRKIRGALIYSTALGEAFPVNADLLSD